MRLSLLALSSVLWVVPAGAGAAVGAGCGSSGPTQSDTPPFALIRGAALAVDGRVRLQTYAASQIVRATIRMDDLNGRIIARTPQGQYSCVALTPDSQRIAVPLTADGSARLRAQRALTVRGNLTLVNGYGVTRDVAFATTIVDARLLSVRSASPCRVEVASPATVMRGATLGIAVRACARRTLGVGLVALTGAHRGNLAVRHTFTPEAAGVLATSITIGAQQTGRYRPVLIAGSKRLARAAHEIVVRKA